MCAAVQPLDLDNLFLFNDGTYSGLQAYKNSKLANVMFAYELTQQLDGSGIKVNAVDPGIIIISTLCLLQTAGVELKHFHAGDDYFY